MTTRKTTILVVLAITLALAGGVWLSLVRAQTAPAGNAPRKPAAEATRASIAAAAQGAYDAYRIKAFATDSYNDAFSILYPDDFTVSRMEDGPDGERVLISAPSQGVVMRIAVSRLPGEEPAPLTVERLRADMPDIVIEEPDYYNSVDGIPALVFRSAAPGGGPTMEAWFVRHSTLFRVSTYPEFSGALLDLLDSWRWQNPW